MSDSQKEILKMLAEKIISVDEAERLLRALGVEDASKKEDPPDPVASTKRGLRMAITSINDKLADIGPMIGSIVADATSSLGVGDDTDLDSDGLERVEFEDDTFSIPEGSTLVLQNDRRSGGCSLKIEGVEGNTCSLSGEVSDGLRVLRNQNRFVVKWKKGDLTVRVPGTVKKLVAKTMGGDIVSTGVHANIEAKTLGGSFKMEGLSEKFNLKTMGGNMMLGIVGGLENGSQATTMGGDIELFAGHGVSGLVKATTMGGDIHTSEDVGILEGGERPGPKKITAEIGSGSDSRVTLKTMGGNISIKVSRDE